MKRRCRKYRARRCSGGRRERNSGPYIELLANICHPLLAEFLFVSVIAIKQPLKRAVHAAFARLAGMGIAS